MERVEGFDRERIEARASIDGHIMGSVPATTADLTFSLVSKVMAYWDHLRGFTSPDLGTMTFTSRESYLNWRFEEGVWAPPRMQATVHGS